MRRFKTLKGLMKSVGKRIVKVSDVLDQRIWFKNGHKTETFILEDSALKEVAEILADNWSKGYHKRVVEKVMGKHGDNSYLQCFYIESCNDGSFRIGNSLNGEAYNYCKRMWLKS